jgi:tRNA(Ile2) C34 agmatinyltransferase TiaS
MIIYVGMDDTDTLESRGTGALARSVAAALGDQYRVLGVVRQQLLPCDPRVPCTKNNSSKGLILEAADGTDLRGLAARVRDLMLADFIVGSDPGLCVAAAVPDEVVEWGRRAQRELLTKEEAIALAARHGIHLEELGGDGMGVIGALAAVGLTAGGEAGRYILVGQARSLAGAQPVEVVLAAGIAAVETEDGSAVTSGLVLTDKLRPARRGGRPVAVVRQDGDAYAPVKLD